MRCEAVRCSASQLRGRESCLRKADPATGAPRFPLLLGRAVQGATAARCTLTLVAGRPERPWRGWKGDRDRFLRGHRLVHCLRVDSDCGQAKTVLAPFLLQTGAEVAVTSRAQATWLQSGTASERGEGTKEGGRWAAYTPTDSFCLLCRA